MWPSTKNIFTIVMQLRKKNIPHTVSTTYTVFYKQNYLPQLSKILKQKVSKAAEQVS